MKAYCYEVEGSAEALADVVEMLVAVSESCTAVNNQIRGVAGNE